MEERTRLLVREPVPIAWLVITSGDRMGRSFRLSEAVKIGRDAAQNEIVLDDEAVSTQHALIRLEGGQYVLYDLASTNGTFVNGQRVYRWALIDGDRITAGTTELAFKMV